MEPDRCAFGGHQERDDGFHGWPEPLPPGISACGARAYQEDLRLRPGRHRYGRRSGRQDERCGRDRARVEVEGAFQDEMVLGSGTNKSFTSVANQNRLVDAFAEHRESALSAPLETIPAAS